MNSPRQGLQIIHNGTPIELLYRLPDQKLNEQIWRVKLLFVDDATERTTIIKSSDLCLMLHTQRAA